MTKPGQPPSDTYRRIYDAVSRIPRGRVATYGQVASLARLPRQARLVGYALNVLPPRSTVPWFRVVNAKGTISLRSDGLGHDQLQARLLAREGVRFIEGARPLPVAPARALGARPAACASVASRLPGCQPGHVFRLPFSLQDPQSSLGLERG
jgi:methylated-DNA-protein-cysteine methyltransferase-like protein